MNNVFKETVVFCVSVRIASIVKACCRGSGWTRRAVRAMRRRLRRTDSNINMYVRTRISINQPFANNGYGVRVSGVTPNKNKNTYRFSK
jgi:hypothetical protein